MSTHIIHRVEGDLAPPVNFELVGQDITGWTIQLQGTYRGTFQPIDIAHTVDIAADGKGHFDWGASDLIKGVADWEMFFTPAGGSPKPFTIPAENSLLLQVRGKKEPGPGVLSGGGDQITINQDGRILKIFGGGGGGVGVTIFPTEVGLLASTLLDGTIAYAQDTDKYFFREAGAWLPRATGTFTDPYVPPTGTFNVTGKISVKGPGVRSEQLGALAAANSTDSTAVGQGATGSGDNTTALGSGATTSGADATALGKSASAGLLSTVVGSGASADSAGGAVAIGSVASTVGLGGVAMGNNASVSAPRGIAIGRIAAAADSAVAIGSQSVGDIAGTAVGDSALSGPRSVAIGDNAKTGSGVPRKEEAVAIGEQAQAGADDSIAIGRTSTTNTVSVGAIALGHGANTAHAGSVAIGRDAATTAAQRATIGKVGGTALELLELQVSNGFAAFGATPPASQPAAIVDASGGATVDAEARTAINALLAVMRANGLITP